MSYRFLYAIPCGAPQYRYSYTEDITENYTPMRMRHSNPPMNSLPVMRSVTQPLLVPTQPMMVPTQPMMVPTQPMMVPTQPIMIAPTPVVLSQPPPSCGCGQFYQYIVPECEDYNSSPTMITQRMI